MCILCCLPLSRVLRIESGSAAPCIVRVQAYPRAIRNHVLQVFPQLPHMNLHPQHYTHILTLVHSKPYHKYFVGLIPRDRYLLPGSVASSIPQSLMTVHEDIVSRAHYKLVESSCLDPALHALLRRAGPKRAVDVGAAPGGWSFLLARHGFHVLAIVRVSHNSM
jgi:hypothetical protein